MGRCLHRSTSDAVGVDEHSTPLEILPRGNGASEDFSQEKLDLWKCVGSPYRFEPIEVIWEVEVSFCRLL